MKSIVNPLTHLNVKRYIGCLLVALFSVSLLACATMEGAGKDIESAGEEIQEAADDN